MMKKKPKLVPTYKMRRMRRAAAERLLIRMFFVSTHHEMSFSEIAEASSWEASQPQVH